MGTVSKIIASLCDGGKIGQLSYNDALHNKIIVAHSFNSVVKYSQDMTLYTLESAIQQTAQQFDAACLYYGHGTDNALDEAAWLVLHVTGLNPIEPIHNPQQTLTEAQQIQLRALTQQRIEQRTPLGYLTKSVYFCGLPFYVDERVLVPRSPIAQMIQREFSPWLPDAPKRILDLCTGSGCIGIACAYAFEKAEVVLSDISQEALEVAQRNINQHELNHRVTTCLSDGLSDVSGTFDLIVSNPPYVDAHDMANLPEEYHQEPELGLSSGDDGLDFTRVLLQQAHRYLNPNGVLVVEVGNSMEALISASAHAPFIWEELSDGGHGVFVLNAVDLPL